jgi:hypothetical protein
MKMLFTGMMAHAVGCRQLDINIPTPISVRELIKLLVLDHPEIKKLIPDIDNDDSILIILDGRIAQLGDLVNESSSVVFSTFLVGG